MYEREPHLLDLTVPPRLLTALGGFLLALAIGGPGLYLWWNQSVPIDVKFGPLRPELRILPKPTYLNVMTFAISVTQITQAQYARVMGLRSIAYQDSVSQSAIHLSLTEALSYCNKLSLLENLEPCYEGTKIKKNCWGYRLPFKEEIEYAIANINSSNVWGLQGLEKYKLSSVSHIVDIDKIGFHIVRSYPDMNF